MTPRHRNRTRSRRRLTLATGYLLTVGVTVLLAHEGHAPLPTKGVQDDIARGQLLLTPMARDSLAVTTAEVESKSMEGKLLAYASVELPWTHRGFATARLPGRIVKVHVAPGQTVRAGDVVAEVRSLELDTLQLEVLTAQKELELSEKIVNELKASAENVAGQTIIDAETRLAKAWNATVVARSRWLALGLSAGSLDELLKRGVASSELILPVRMPVGGTVIHAELTAGKVVEPTEHLAEVADLSTVWVRVRLLEKDLNRVIVGTPIDVRLVAHPGEVFRTTISAVAPYLDPTTHLTYVWAELKNPPGSPPRFVPGMAGQADIILPADKPRLTVPIAAVVREGVDRFVFVEEANAKGASEYRRKLVALGRHTEGRVEIVAGELFPGDRVVISGAHELGGLFMPGVLRLSPETQRAINLRVENGTAGTVDDTVTLDGAVDLPPANRGSATSQLAGVIASIRTDRGRTVKAGDILAEVISPDLQSIQLDLIRASLDLQLEVATLARIQNVAAIPRRRVWETESRVASLQSQVETFRLKLSTVGLSPREIDRIIESKQVLSAVPVRSPINGTVVTFDKSLGQAVLAQEVLFNIYDRSKPWVMGFVSERDVARVRVGQAVRVRLVSDPSKVMTGRIARSGETFGVENRSMTVWVELDAKSQLPLIHGQLASLTVVTGSHSATVTVPVGAIAQEAGSAYVFIRRPDGVFERRAVELGRSDDVRVEIVRGLQADTPVATSGVSDLVTGFASLR